MCGTCRNSNRTRAAEYWKPWLFDIAECRSLDDIDASGNHTPQASEAERLLTQATRDARRAVLDVLKKLE